MSATEWLPYISPYIWFLLILNGLALFSMRPKDRSSFRIKLTLVLFATVFLGWLIAKITLHVTTPVWRTNLLASSEVILTPTLIALGVLLIVRLIQGNNFLTTLIRLIGKLLMRALNFSTPVLPAILHFSAGTFSRHADELQKNEEEKEEEMRDKIHVNWKGEYSGEDDWNMY
jgi:hypothetical protein